VSVSRVLGGFACCVLISLYISFVHTVSSPDASSSTLAIYPASRAFNVLAFFKNGDLCLIWDASIDNMAGYSVSWDPASEYTAAMGRPRSRTMC
jgi:uncharacterized membrane protein YfcA